MWTQKLHSEARHELDAASLSKQQYDSVAQPDTGEVVVYQRFQAVPRYVIAFRRLELPPAAPAVWREVFFHGGAYVQRLTDPSHVALGEDGTTRARAVDTHSHREVSLELTHAEMMVGVAPRQGWLMAAGTLLIGLPQAYPRPGGRGARGRGAAPCRARVRRPCNHM